MQFDTYVSKALVNHKGVSMYKSAKVHSSRRKFEAHSSRSRKLCLQLLWYNWDYDSCGHDSQEWLDALSR